jgi:hypothetical protein
MGFVPVVKEINKSFSSKRALQEYLEGLYDVIEAWDGTVDEYTVRISVNGWVGGKPSIEE